jgi:hypothetical protein
MKKEKEIERVITEYLSNKNAVLKDDFTESLIHEIEELGVSRNKGNRGVGYLIPIVSLAFVACVMFFLPVFFSQEESIQDGNQLAIRNASVTPQLEESEKILIEDLMAIPEDLNVPGTFLSEQAYDLLVLLDT